MPHHKSAKKRMKQNVIRRARNRARRTHLRTQVKRLHTMMAENDVEGAKAFLPELYKTIDQAAAYGILHQNNASRQKSRLTIAVNRLSS